MIAFDLDGTLSDLQNRLHHIQDLTASATRAEKEKAYRAFFADCGNDTPIHHAKIIWDCLVNNGYDLCIVTGRSDEVRQETVNWLVEHGFFANEGIAEQYLYMRSEGDRRPDSIAKAELMDQAVADWGHCDLVFEDRASVVALWRERGIPCYQVAPGDF